MTKDSDSNKKNSIQCVTISVASLIGAAINGIVGYIAVYLFKPLWTAIIKLLDAKQDYWNKK